MEYNNTENFPTETWDNMEIQTKAKLIFSKQMTKHK